MSGLVATMIGWGGDNLMSALLMALMLGAMVVGYFAAAPGNPLALRLGTLKDRVSGKAPVGKKPGFKFTFSMATLKRLVEALKLTRGEEAQSTADKLLKAGYRSREALVIYMGIRLVVPVVLTSLVFLVVSLFHLAMAQLVLSGAGIAISATYLPPMVLKKITAGRNRRFTRSLPDVLDLLVICAEGGLSLDGALSRVAREFRRFLPEMADELGLTAIELGFLPQRRDALDNLAKRVDIPGMHSLTHTLIQTERYGTPLAQSLRALSSELREERMLKAEEKAAKLPATMTVPMILFILPATFIILVGPAALNVYHVMHQH
ncbi:MAG TPA: type II secretion system F family protein [Stellaceae bacterium]|jgi:tight adherence protein C|nr:type II secretion system F family protein [Stellaceae bacterium]